MGCLNGTGFVPPILIPALTRADSRTPLTRAAELILLDLGHVEATELGWSGALGEKPDGGTLAQPL